METIAEYLIPAGRFIRSTLTMPSPRSNLSTIDRVEIPRRSLAAFSYFESTFPTSNAFAPRVADEAKKSNPIGTSTILSDTFAIGIRLYDKTLPPIVNVGFHSIRPKSIFSPRDIAYLMPSEPCWQYSLRELLAVDPHPSYLPGPQSSIAMLNCPICSAVCLTLESRRRSR